MYACVRLYVCVGEWASLRKLVKFLALRQSLDLNLVIMYIQSVKFLFAHMYVHDERCTNTHAFRHLFYAFIRIQVCVCVCVFDTRNLTHLSVTMIRISKLILTYAHTNTHTHSNRHFIHNNHMADIGHTHRHARVHACVCVYEVRPSPSCKQSETPQDKRCSANLINCLLIYHLY